ncbi:MAG: DUF2336 domain-containing protein [Rhodobiaceae bacterium]|nr:DUF2336 domain-containing protein [Rhodobiaceae bacterium]MCC0055970.1 DUF2336 domain-containing protein [Rhodobiaceae bacterium]
MLLQRFLTRLEEGRPTERAEIAAALARVFLDSPLDEINRSEALAVLTVITDDPAPVVRRALANVFAGEPDAPRQIVRVLAADLGGVAEPLLLASPVLRDEDLIDIVGDCGSAHHRAVARRQPVSAGLAAAIVELADADACLALVENPHARLTRGTMARLIHRHGGNGELREALLGRGDLPMEMRHDLVEGMVGALSEFLVSRSWLSPHRAKRTLDEAFAEGMIRMGGAEGTKGLKAAAERLARRGNLDEKLLLRAICLGEDDFAIAGFAVLSGLPERRAAALYQDAGNGFAALCRKSRIERPEAAVLRAARLANLMLGDEGRDLSVSARRLIVVERVLTAIAAEGDRCAPLSALMVRLGSELARNEARELTGGYFRAA